ncbi:hypothetical protein ABVK25_004952 [Lepraria finkii]|uniref:Uncharacterized protein n=1 Tax=Lepraria finkii TaxID=1340010 RepID=A0ABR4BCV7_9LECA
MPDVVYREDWATNIRVAPRDKTNIHGPIRIYFHTKYQQTHITYRPTAIMNFHEQPSSHVQVKHQPAYPVMFDPSLVVHTDSPALTFSLSVTSQGQSSARLGHFQLWGIYTGHMIEALAKLHKSMVHKARTTITFY